MVTRIDLLVHTTAPSSRNDDERFKTQAEAYTSFVAAGTSSRVISHGSTSRLPLSSPDDVFEANVIDEMRQTSAKPDSEPSNIICDPTTFLEETQLGYTALESQIFPTSSRTPRKTFKRALPVEQQIHEDKIPGTEGTEHHASRQDESSSSHRIPSQSSYLMSPVLDRSSKKPRINEANRQYFQSSRSVLPPSEPAQYNGELVTASTGPAPTLGQTALESQQHSFPGDDITSELPTSYSLSDMSPESHRNRQNSIQRSTSDPGPTADGPVDSQSAEQRRSGVSQELPLRHAIQEDETEANQSHARQTHPKSSNSETAVKDFAPVRNEDERIKATPIITTTDPSTHPDLPITIRAPAPQPSLQPFKTHITDSLKYLDETASLAQSYKPIYVSRDPEQSERGSWTFDITPWPPQLRTEFFAFLAKMIEPGRVGWGVWCVREGSPLALVVRVFCWGEVVRHVYLMLYVASKSKVRKLGLRWVDAGGEVVVQMRGPGGEGGMVK